VTVRVAELPPGFTDTEFTTIPGGTSEGRNVKLEEVRLTPVTCTDESVALDRVKLGLIETIFGAGRTVKGVLEVAVVEPTVTEIGPVVAPVGTLTSKVVVVAERTVAATPLNLTSFADGVALKPCPCILT
jgi:hypothetical protein